MALTPAQRETAQLHAAVLEAAATNMQQVAYRANDLDPVLRHVDSQLMQTLSSATLITAMAYRRAINGSLEIEV